MAGLRISLSAPTSPVYRPESRGSRQSTRFLGGRELHLFWAGQSSSRQIRKHVRVVCAAGSSADEYSDCRQLKEEEACKPLYGLMSSFSSPEEDFSSHPSEDLGAKIDVNLPRRRLQVSFTCDACGERSQRLINPHAYKLGTVFVQCAGCETYHKLVDNLGLIEEYDFRGEMDRKADGPGGSDAPEEAISNNGD